MWRWLKGILGGSTSTDPASTPDRKTPTSQVGPPPATPPSLSVSRQSQPAVRRPTATVSERGPAQRQRAAVSKNSNTRNPHDSAAVRWAGAGGEFDVGTLVGVSDPFALTPLQPGETIVLCRRCKVGYHQETAQFLQEQNGGNCVGCAHSDQMMPFVLPGSGSVTRVISTPIPPSTDVIVEIPKVATHVGQVVTVEGFVYLVHLSKNGTYFIKFEQTPRPFDGFKLVVFNRYAPAWSVSGIDPKAYQRRYLRVRGLIQDHPEWGLEIIVDRPEMISIVDASSITQGKRGEQRIEWRT